MQVEYFSSLQLHFSRPLLSYEVCISLHYVVLVVNISFYLLVTAIYVKLQLCHTKISRIKTNQIQTTGQLEKLLVQLNQVKQSYKHYDLLLAMATACYRAAWLHMQSSNVLVKEANTGNFSGRCKTTELGRREITVLPLLQRYYHFLK